MPNRTLDEGSVNLKSYNRARNVLFVAKVEFIDLTNSQVFYISSARIFRSLGCGILTFEAG